MYKNHYGFKELVLIRIKFLLSEDNVYSAFALLAVQTAVLARPFLSVCPSIIPSRSDIVSRRMNVFSIR